MCLASWPKRPLVEYGGDLKFKTLAFAAPPSSVLDPQPSTAPFRVSGFEVDGC